MQILFRTFLVLLASTFLTTCSIANLQPDTLANSNVPDADTKGRELLQMTYDKMGYANLKDVEVYEMTARFDWSPVWSAMPMNALPGNKGKDVQFRFAPNTFDGHVEYLEGPKAGHIYGIQSWESYQRENHEAPVEKLSSNRYPWALTAYHYILEGPMRLLGADIIRHAGEKAFNGKNYDLVFVTWGDGSQKKEYDQYLLYIDQQTGFTDLAEITITDFFLPMPNGMKNATVQYPDRIKTSIGAWLPTRNIIQLGQPKDKLDKDVYTFTYRDYQFDSFDKKSIYPMEGLKMYGDSKPEAK
jgi:hypothetical protein